MTFTIKPLEWHGPDFEGEYWAAWIGGKYTIQKPNGNGMWLGGVGGYFQTVEEAKAAAEADYHQRILTILSLPVQEPVVSEPVAWQRKLRKRGTSGWGEWKECTKSQADYAEGYGHPQDFEEVEAVVRPLYASPQPSAIITEEMVERAAKAMSKEWRSKSNYFDVLARTALTAALQEGV